jgi:hypothetical protein
VSVLPGQISESPPCAADEQVYHGASLPPLPVVARLAGQFHDHEVLRRRKAPPMSGHFKIRRYVVSRQGSTVSEGRISLFPDSSYSGPVDEVNLYFRGDFFGDVVSNGQKTAVRALLSPHEFEHWYRILQSEKPVFLHWEDDQDKKLVTITLASSEEPPGEGIDRSG